jgi:excisionase family DNA binding protein
LEKEETVRPDLLRASEAARRLDLSTKELLRLVRDSKIRYVMVDGIAHIPSEAVEEYRTKAS